MNKITTLIKKYKTALLFSGILGIYVYIAGTTGSCSACSSILGALQIPSIVSTAHAEEKPYIQVASAKSKPAPEWKLKDLDGNEVTSADFQGKVVLIDFWATWCPPCRKMIPGLVELDKEYKDQGLAIIGISLDQEGAKAVKPFNKKYGVEYTSILGDQNVVSAFGGIRGIPTSFLIDRDGNIVEKHVGYIPKSKIEEEIKSLL